VSEIVRAAVQSRPHFPLAAGSRRGAAPARPASWPTAGLGRRRFRRLRSSCRGPGSHRRHCPRVVPQRHHRRHQGGCCCPVPLLLCAARRRLAHLGPCQRCTRRGPPCCSLEQQRREAGPTSLLRKVQNEAVAAEAAAGADHLAQWPPGGAVN